MSSRIPYSDYLLSEHWKLTRERALVRAGHRCQGGDCPLAHFYPHEIAEWFPRSWARLEVHHLTYERLGAEAPDDLLVLCARCHAVAHGQSLPEDGAIGPIQLRDVVAGMAVFRRLGEHHE